MTWHKHITRDSTSNSSKSFSLLSRTHKNIQPAYYILYMQTHIIFFIAIVCAYSWFCWCFFFGIMFSPHHYWKKLKLSKKKKKKACFICAPHKNTQSHSFLHTREQKQWTSMSLSWFHKTDSDWVSYLHVSSAYWYCTKGNIPSSVKKITMKQSKIILAEVPELKKLLFDLLKHIPNCTEFKPLVSMRSYS